MKAQSIRTRVKLCGMTDPEQVEHAIIHGVDAIGMILHATSPRTINIARAKAIREIVPPMVTLVGVFVNYDAAAINKVIDEVGLDCVQLHGDESDAEGRSLNRPFIKAIRVKSRDQLEHQIAMYPSASAILLDPYVAGQHGGTGTVLDLSCWPSEHNHRLILAGGLSNLNVVERIQKLHPFAVDLNSGLESTPGNKNPTLVEEAMLAIRCIR